MILYLAGQMAGIPDLNWPAFDAAALRLRGEGHEVINPAEMDREDGISAEVWENATEHGKNQMMRDVFTKDFSSLLTCDGIALLPGWEKSRGARVELAIAQMMRMPVLCARTSQRMIHLEHHEVSYEPVVSNT